MSAALQDTELCEYFESLSEARRELVWIRCERILGRPVARAHAFEELNDEQAEELLDAIADDTELDDVWEQVLTDMWCTEQLRRLVGLGRLECASDAEGQLVYFSA